MVAKNRLKKSEIRYYRNIVQQEIDELKVELFSYKHGGIKILPEIQKEKTTDLERAIVNKVKDYFLYGILPEDPYDTYYTWGV